MVAIFLLKLDANILPAQKRSSDKAAARSGKWVQDNIACPGESFDDRHESVDGLLGRMVVVAGIVPRQYVVDRIGRQLRPPLRENIRGFVRVPQEALGGCIGLSENNVADRREARALPRREERIHAVPAVERNT